MGQAGGSSWGAKLAKIGQLQSLGAMWARFASGAAVRSHQLWLQNRFARVQEQRVKAAVNPVAAPAPSCLLD